MHAARPETGARIDDVAAGWAARVDRAPLSPDEERQLEAWLNADARHFGAYARAQAISARFDRAQALGSQFDPATFAAPAPLQPSDRRGVRRWAAAAIAASFVMAIAVALFVKLTPEKFSTDLGEVRLVSLPDGSRVTLNTASTVKVRYTDSARYVQLIDGEALFTVAKDPARPFVVASNDTQVRAIGTSFTVRSLPGETVQVLVREGVVEVTRGEAAAAAVPVRLTANTRAYAAPRGSVKVAEMSGTEVARELAWREGMISFGGVTLREAAQEFARYSDVRIVFDDPALAERTVTGLFASNNPLGFAQAIATSMNLAVLAQGRSVHLKKLAGPMAETASPGI